MYYVMVDVFSGEPFELVTDRDKAWLLAYCCADTIEEYSVFQYALDRMKWIS